MPKYIIKVFSLILILFCCSNRICSQDIIATIDVLILSDKTKKSLPGATAFNIKSKEGYISDKNGIVKIKYTDNEAVFEFSFLGYTQKRFNLNEVPDTIYLEKDLNILDNITIVTEKIPQALTEKSETITDFVMDEDKIILLTKDIGHKYILRLTNLVGEQISNLELVNFKKVEELITSCFGTHFLIGRKEVLQLYVLNNKIIILDRSTRKLFDQYIKPCITENNDFIYSEKRKVKDQIASIYRMDKNTGETILFAGISDDENLKRYKHDAPYMNYVDGTGPLHLGIHARNVNDAIQWGDMLNMHFYLPVDYFMMSHRDKILIFDHEKFKLKVLDQNGNKIQEYPIDYPKQKGWKSKDNLYIDRITNRLYAVHRLGVNTYITEIDLKNGASKKRFKVKARFVEKIAVHNGFVYYTNSSIVQSSRILNRIKL